LTLCFSKQMELVSLPDIMSLPVLAISLFVIGSLLSIMAYFSSGSAKRKSNMKSLVIVNIISALANIATCLGAVHKVNLLKYGQWAISFPLLISLLGNITNKHQHVQELSFYFYAFIICQFIANISVQPMATYAMAPGLYCYYIMIVGIEGMFANVIVSLLNRPSRIALRGIVLVVWGLCKKKFYLI
jgi:hypothetical protein